MKRLAILRARLEAGPESWDSSKPVFFLLEEAMDAAGQEIAEIAKLEAAMRAREQLSRARS